MLGGRGCTEDPTPYSKQVRKAFILKENPAIPEMLGCK